VREKTQTKGQMAQGERRSRLGGVGVRAGVRRPPVSGPSVGGPRTAQGSALPGDFPNVLGPLVRELR